MRWPGETIGTDPFAIRPATRNRRVAEHPTADSIDFCAAYSYLSATTGSTSIARLAGT